MFKEVDRILIEALKEAGALHNTYLGSEHLLLAILRDEKLQITQVLNSFGMHYHDVRQDVLELNDSYDLSKREEGYSLAVQAIVANADSSASMVLEILRHEDTLAYHLLQRYEVPFEKVMN